MTPPDYDNLLTRANRYLNAGGFIPEICSEMYGAIIVLREQNVNLEQSCEILRGECRHLRKHAERAEAENAALREQEARTQKVLEETVESMGTTIIRIEAERDAPLKLVAEQAEDEGLWFMAQTAPEAYLQQELRKLHAAIEGDAALLAGKETP